MFILLVRITSKSPTSKSPTLAFRELLDIITSYFDNIRVHSKQLNNYLSYLRPVFEVVRKYNFTLRPDKCLFFQEEAELLGHIISPDRIKPASKTLDKVANFELSNKAELKSFIYVDFIWSMFNQLVEIASPLANLLKQDNKFILGTKEIIA